MRINKGVDALNIGNTASDVWDFGKSVSNEFGSGGNLYDGDNTDGQKMNTKLIYKDGKYMRNPDYIPNQEEKQGIEEARLAGQRINEQIQQMPQQSNFSSFKKENPVVGTVMDLMSPVDMEASERLGTDDFSKMDAVSLGLSAALPIVGKYAGRGLKAVSKGVRKGNPLRRANFTVDELDDLAIRYNQNPKRLEQRIINPIRNNNI